MFELIPLCVVLSTSLLGTFSQCPSSEWIVCGKENGNCIIDFTYGFNQTTIAYGNAQNNKWTFQDVSVTKSQTFSCQCSDASFGNSDNGYPKVCCYTDQGSILSDHVNGEAGDENNYIFLTGVSNPVWIANYVGDKYVYWIRFGTSEQGIYTYRAFNNYVPCHQAAFMYLNNINSGLGCWLYKIPISTNWTYYSGWYGCGYENSGDGQCNFNVDASLNAPAIRFVSYGTGDELMYRWLLSNNGYIDCQDYLFDNGDNGQPSECFILDAAYSNYFTKNIGQWQLVNSCAGCSSINVNIDEGVTSSSGYAAEQQWASSITQSVSESCGFMDDSVSYELSETTSHSISSQMSITFTKKYDQSCGAICGDGSTSSNWYLWQWILSTNEQIGLATKPFNTFQCGYVCSKSNVSPKCPLGYCANSNCTQCTPWN